MSSQWILKEEIDEILDCYDQANLKIATIGSHSALQILKGARDENFKSLAICSEAVSWFYEQFDFIDEVISVRNYKDILKKRFQEELIQDNCILIPHGSFVEYVGAEAILTKLKVPCFGNRITLEWESDREKEMSWFEEARIKVPKVFKKPEEIDRLAIVKFFGAKGGKGYFLVRNKDEFYEMKKFIKKANSYLIQEYVIGTRFYPHYFYSKILDRLELLGMDIRYESNVDALGRIPPRISRSLELRESYSITGNIPVVARESLLPKILEIGYNLLNASRKLFSFGIIGPFCIEMICTEHLELVCFEISSRIVAGTNFYMDGSPYSSLYFDEPMSCGRRICREINLALSSGRLKEVIF